MPSNLQSLITEATRYARFTMKKCGCLAPIMMAATDQGTILFTPDKLSDTGAKDDFANKVRLITASYGASAVVLILESWITKAKADEPLDTLTPPSESYDREEVVDERSDSKWMLSFLLQGMVRSCCQLELVPSPSW